MDIVATCCDLAGVNMAPELLDGESFRPILHGDETNRTQPIFWEHQGNCAMREGQWKLVSRRNDSEENGGHDGVADLKCWELYNVDEDRPETKNLAMHNRDRVNNMAKKWAEWALRVGVKPWPLQPLSEGEKDWSNLPWMW